MKTEFMKNILYTIILSFLFSFNVCAEWTFVTKSSTGNNIYVDLEGIRKQDGYIYWWDLTDNVKNAPAGYLSAKKYNQADCQLFRVRVLSVNFYNKWMGRGEFINLSHNELPEKWRKWLFPPPSSPYEVILRSVCRR